MPGLTAHELQHEADQLNHFNVARAERAAAHLHAGDVRHLEHEVKDIMHRDHISVRQVEDIAESFDAHHMTTTQKAGMFGFLNAHDCVAISFWIISIAMIAATVFFLMESQTLKPHWRTSMNVGALVTLVAAVHYMYMREYWVKVQASPIVYRYIDWSITVPLQMVEFYLILSAVNPNIGGGMFWRLLIGTVIMLAFGYAGESLAMDGWVAFIGGMAGWAYILYEIFMGPAGQTASDSKMVNEYVRSSFQSMRFIVTVGWAIYPLGYFFGFLTGAVRDAPLNIVYNLADLVNKIAFCLAIWQAARKDSLNQGSGLRKPLM